MDSEVFDFGFRIKKILNTNKEWILILLLNYFGQDLPVFVPRKGGTSPRQAGFLGYSFPGFPACPPQLEIKNEGGIKACKPNRLQRKKNIKLEILKSLH